VEDINTAVARFSEAVTDFTGIAIVNVLEQSGNIEQGIVDVCQQLKDLRHDDIRRVVQALESNYAFNVTDLRLET